MNQKDFIISLAQEGLSFTEIQNKANEEYGRHAFKRSYIYKLMQEVKLGVTHEEEGDKPGRKPDEQLLIRIVQVLEEKPYFTVRRIADKLKENPSTIYRYLTQYLGMVYKFTKWIPHLLNSEQKQKRVEEAKALLLVLRSCKKMGWHNIITGDESWFTMYYGARGGWVENDENGPTFSGSTIDNEKIMVTVIWGVYSIHLINFLPTSEHFNTAYFQANIMQPLSKNRDLIWPGNNKRKIWLHLDNCKVHNSAVSQKFYEPLGFKRAPHPPYSPDLAPSDYFLFGYAKNELRGEVFESIDDLQARIEEIFMSISIEKKKEVFEAWIKRCEWVIDNEGEYYAEH